ncbi:YD repeat-containing protein [Saccharopolyspora antimicrobica]|uniref:YD repeat-containing protein n=1 Tax=Saccharopolyspora antimicrobica TaxID=455193 RepID=A0A1I4TS70_9PSEU|nr:YD repeat-containing protein [Saccharopolyspora antimicrobica]SFM79511.1 YD repeat-containing protein [Saccharopolyspora antimicrobica]
MRGDAVDFAPASHGDAVHLVARFPCRITPLDPRSGTPRCDPAAEEVADGTATEFVYDPDGQRLLRRDPGGTTLYLDE